MKRLCIIMSAMLLSACQLTLPPKTTDWINNLGPSNYGQYYLELKQLNTEQLLTEKKHQKQTKNNEFDSNIKLLMIYSLPNPTVNNPYTAKSVLNQYQFDNSEFDQVKQSDIALLTVLKDQLNQQLLLFQKFTGQDLVKDQYIEKLAQQQNTIISLTKKLSLLTLQLQQLKTIEHNINNHGANRQ